MLNISKETRWELLIGNSCF